uniref:N-acetyltransferase domain-containing protein n=1 Tax=Kalanchoe fedtschenkoi TaxID=63787 RepID=A0A7N0RJN8_KALFE
MDAHGVSAFLPRFAAGDATWPTIRACNRYGVTAACFKAQAYWEAHPGMRMLNSISLLPYHLEFLGMKRRYSGQEGNLLKYFCLVAVKKEDKNRRINVVKSIVGTLELSIDGVSPEKRIPGSSTGLVAAPEPPDADRYAYISNVIVAKYARRRGIATNMIYLAADVAGSTGMNKLLVHVNAANTPARDLYRKCGFKFFDTASPQPSEDNTLLMCMELD